MLEAELGARIQEQFTKALGSKEAAFRGMGLWDPHHMIQQKGQKEDGARKPQGKRLFICAIHLVSTNISTQQTKQSALRTCGASWEQKEIHIF